MSSVSRSRWHSLLRAGETLWTVGRISGMMPRSALIGALVMIEVAIAGESLVALHGGASAAWSARAMDTPGQSARLAEDGPHRVFAVGARPVLSVDIGDADLTVLTRVGTRMEVSVSSSTDYGLLRATAPIRVRQEGDTLRVAIDAKAHWVMGDNRMVTVIVPVNTRVAVVDAGEIKATDLRAEASLHSIGSGSVMVENYNGPSLNALSQNGRVSLNRIVAGRLDATSRNDRVDGTELQVRDGNVEAGDRVTLAFTSKADTQIRAEARCGEIRIAGTTGISSLGKPNAISDEGDDSVTSRTVRLGAGDGHLSVHSTDGDIALVGNE